MKKLIPVILTLLLMLSASFSALAAVTIDGWSIVGPDNVFVDSDGALIIGRHITRTSANISVDCETALTGDFTVEFQVNAMKEPDGAADQKFCVSIMPGSSQQWWGAGYWFRLTSSYLQITDNTVSPLQQTLSETAVINADGMNSVKITRTGNILIFELNGSEAHRLDLVGDKCFISVGANYACAEGVDASAFNDFVTLRGMKIFNDGLTLEFFGEADEISASSVPVSSEAASNAPSSVVIAPPADEPGCGNRA